MKPKREERGQFPEEIWGMLANMGGSMTDAREWPNNAKDARDQAAENINEALIALSGVARRMTVNAEDARDLMGAVLRLNDSVRWLESVGAPTRPRRI